MAIGIASITRDDLAWREDDVGDPLLLHMSLREERQDCLEDKVSAHHPPTPDRILANKG